MVLVFLVWMFLPASQLVQVRYLSYLFVECLWFVWVSI